ncbi:MAG TPA: hypothetical protein VGY48_02975 [Vicinamibacterales bacterium]|jgi:hypothetical protein|nr:hypothetical protein [Vicinamibacterales bacterium]
MSRTFKLSTGLGVGAAVFLTTAISTANIQWDQPSGTNPYDWTITQHWVYNRTVAQYNTTYAPWACTYGCMYHAIGDGNGNTSWGGPGLAAPECLEIATHPTQTTTNPDTVIEVMGGDAQWQMVNDDFGGTLQSRARIWINASQATMEFGLRIRGYSTNQQFDDFLVTITRRDTSYGNSQCAPGHCTTAQLESACTSGQTIPWADITQVSGAPSAVITLSNFHQ